MTVHALPVDLALAQRAGALYLPLLAALLLAHVRGRHPRRFAACLLGLLWAAPALLPLELLNLRMVWWSFPFDSPSGPALRGMPLELWIGWAVLWGILPTLAFPRLPLGWVAAILAAFDLLGMPLCGRIVRLGPDWLLGEAAALLIVLLPALYLARWTQQDTHLALRVTLQVAAAGLLFLFFVPEVVFALRPGPHWRPLFEMPGWQRQLASALLFILALPGVDAAIEFALRGEGTPIPYDPPKRLVTSGVYRFLANPMQLSCTLVMLLWAAILRNLWLALPAGIAAVYSAGLARWDERQDLDARFGNPWRAYREEVRDWLPRWRPYHSGGPARLYLAATCAPCSQLRRWIEARSPVGLETLPAESLLPACVQRMTYDPGDGSDAVTGIRALGRALEHLNLAWALAGAALRLPGVWQLVQLTMDVGGFGPRQLVCPAPHRTHVH